MKIRLFFSASIEIFQCIYTGNKNYKEKKQKPNTFTQQIKRTVRPSSIALKDIQIFLEEQFNLLYQICWNKLLWIS